MVPVRGALWSPVRLRLSALALALALLTALGIDQVDRSRHVRVPLLSSSVLLDASGARLAIGAASPEQAYDGTRVAGRRGLAETARRQREWLAAGWRPAPGAPYRRLVTDALLDLDTLLLPGGASVAGWPGPWRYVWPRDASFVAVALARTGHAADARSVLGFLQRVQGSDGALAARYLPDGSGVPDGRGEESDGPGWVLWALRESVTALPAPERPAMLAALAPLLDRSEHRLLELTASGDHLPAPSLDYWEVRDDRLALGTAAPVALGLHAAADLRGLQGSPAEAAADAVRAGQVDAAVRARFGRGGYQRYAGAGGSDGGVDAAVTFLVPPFASTCDPAVTAAWRGAAARMHRPAGGVAPGEGWKDDGISWTPETALLALTSAATGERGPALDRLRWLGEHATAHDALPEKVLSDGSPAGPAPLAWTAALVVLTAHELEAPAVTAAC